MRTFEVPARVDAEFERVLDHRDLRCLFQPVVQLQSREVVGYEALVRGPEGSTLASADSLLAAANRVGRLVELDWAARASACGAALDAGLDPDHLLFLNIEPLALDSECPPDLCPAIAQAFNTFGVVLEVTERSLDRDPGALLDGIERQRPAVAGIALDDVGSNPATLSLLPLVAPTVIKIDQSVVRAGVTDAVADVLHSVEEEVERTGAVVLVEGVEATEDPRRAMAYGGQLGQGHLLGSPAPLPLASLRPRHIVALHRSAPLVVASPFDVLAGQVGGTADDDLLYALMRRLAACAEGPVPALVVYLLPAKHQLEQQELQRLGELAERGTFAAVLGPDVPSEPGYGVRGIGEGRGLPPDDQWASITFGPCSNAAVLARRTSGGDGDWVYGITHDRSRVIAAARSLIRLLGPPAQRFRFQDESET